MCVCSVDGTLLKHGEVRLKASTWTHMLQGIQDLAIGAVLLQNTSIHFHIVQLFDTPQR